jgi:hypothetical protein
MPRIRPRVCEYCNKQSPLKLTSTYARWYPYMADSVGYALSLCDSCVEQFLVPAIASSWEVSFEDDHCPLCHDPWSDDWTFTWLVSYARKEEPARFTVTACEPCMLSFRARFIAYGRKLSDRPRALDEGTHDYWSRLGIEPKPAS